MRIFESSVTQKLPFWVIILKKSGLAKGRFFLLLYPAVVILQLQWMLS